MKIRILCVGKIKEIFYRERIREYSRIIQKHCSFEILEVMDERTDRDRSETEIRQIQRAEGERLLKYLNPNGKELVIALCIDGDACSSEVWSRRLVEQVKEQEITLLTFIIGGSLGLDERVVRRADQRLSFSKLTFPHQLMRVMLAEQIVKLSSQL